MNIFHGNRRVNEIITIAAVMCDKNGSRKPISFEIIDLPKSQIKDRDKPMVVNEIAPYSFIKHLPLTEENLNNKDFMRRTIVLVLETGLEHANKIHACFGMCDEMKRLMLKYGIIMEVE